MKREEKDLGSGGGKGKDHKNTRDNIDKIDIDAIMFRDVSKTEYNDTLVHLIDETLDVVRKSIKDDPDVIYSYLKTWIETMHSMSDVLLVYQSIEKLVDITENRYPDGIEDLSNELAMMFMEMIIDRNEANDPLWIFLSMLKTIKNMLMWAYNANMLFAYIAMLIDKKLYLKSELTEDDIKDIKDIVYKRFKE